MNAEQKDRIRLFAGELLAAHAEREKAAAALRQAQIEFNNLESTLLAAAQDAWSAGDVQTIAGNVIAVPGGSSVIEIPEEYWDRQQGDRVLIKSLMF